LRIVASIITVIYWQRLMGGLCLDSKVRHTSSASGQQDTSGLPHVLENGTHMNLILVVNIKRAASSTDNRRKMAKELGTVSGHTFEEKIGGIRSRSIEIALTLLAFSS
jgi:hypothetical protein